MRKLGDVRKKVSNFSVFCFIYLFTDVPLYALYVKLFNYLRSFPFPGMVYNW